jgi:hypothetical protein
MLDLVYFYKDIPMDIWNLDIIKNSLFLSITIMIPVVLIFYLVNIINKRISQMFFTFDK